MRVIIAVGLAFAGLNVLGVVTGVGSVISLYSFYAQQLPEPGAITAVEDDFQTTKIYDRTGQHLIYEVIDPLGGDRTWIEMSEVPDHMRQATISIEDKTFYENPGYDLEGIIRAMYNNLTGGEIQGGSSITQQLVKNVLIEPEERAELSFERKTKELILAIRISNEYSKDQILEWYLNTNFYGNIAYGVEAAAQVYFDKSVSQLSLAESAMLAAIPQSPALNPIDNPELAKERQRVVLNAMVDEGYITPEQAEAAFAQELNIRQPDERFSLLAPHFSIYALNQLTDLPGITPRDVYRGGLTVYTTLDYDLFLQAECAARSHIVRLSGASPSAQVQTSEGTPCQAAADLYPLAPDQIGTNHNATNAAVVVMNVRTGEILAMVGSLDYYNDAIDGKFNVATAERQPGSVFKPFTYLTAFEQGYTPATMTLDVRTAFDIDSSTPYTPENFDREFHGPQSIRSALANSYNVPAVQVLEWVGIDSTIRTAHQLGINTLDRGLDYYGLSLTLGGGELTLMDTTYAYAVMGNMGNMPGVPIPPDERRTGFRTVDPSAILRVERPDGSIIWEYGQSYSFRSAPVIQAELAYLINDILSDEVARQPSLGEDNALDTSMPAAVKTGTTNDFRDNWTVGHSPNIVTGVWVGNTDNTAMIDLPAVEGAAPIWHAVMEYAHRELPAEGWAQPPNIQQMVVCQTSGMLPTRYCPQTRTEIFISGTEPTEYDTLYQPFLINRQTGLLATAYTQPELVEERVYMVLPERARDWARDAGIDQPPEDYDVVISPDTLGPIAVTDPSPFSYVRGVLEVNGNVQTRNFRSFTLSYGEGLNPQEWFQIGEEQREQKSDELLGIWDTRALNGLYSLRLQVVRFDNSIDEFVMQVTVDNQPPTVEMVTPQPEQTYTMNDEFVVIQPLITDNISMERVEFYVDGELIATSTIAPFNERWIISGPGQYIIEVRAYDRVGNSTISDRIRVNVEP
jgi:membrane carboxypeptidase/penicillin-binding protein